MQRNEYKRALPSECTPEIPEWAIRAIYGPLLALLAPKPTPPSKTRRASSSAGVGSSRDNNEYNQKFPKRFICPPARQRFMVSSFILYLRGPPLRPPTPLSRVSIRGPTATKKLIQMATPTQTWTPWRCSTECRFHPFS